MILASNLCYISTDFGKHTHQALSVLDSLRSIKIIVSLHSDYWIKNYLSIKELIKI
jgi:hypothetical protein